jgi:FkbM family methyltransferase
MKPAPADLARSARPADDRHRRAKGAHKPKTTRLPDGVKFYCVDHREVPLLFQEICQDQTYLQNGIELSPQMTIFDVGANIGMFSYELARRLPAAKVFAFEPLPPVFGALEQNIAEHRLENVKAFNCGLSSQEGSAEFKFYKYAAGWSTMHPFDTPEFRETMRVNMMAHKTLPWYAALLFKIPFFGAALAKRLVAIQMAHETFGCHLRTISSVMQESQVETIDLLKIDVERAELSVLQGIKDSDWPKIRQIVLEVQSDLDPDNRRKVMELLKTKGFRLVEQKSDYLLNADGHSPNTTLYAFREQPVAALSAGVSLAG